MPTPFPRCFWRTCGRSSAGATPRACPPNCGRNWKKTWPGRANHPLPQPPGKQPHGPVRWLRGGAHLPPLLGPPDLSQRQQPADVPLLRLLPPAPPVCPQCGGRFQFVGIGTQKLQEELQALYPDTEVMRMDADTVTATHSHEVLLDRFRRKKGPHPPGYPDGGQGAGFSQRHAGGGGGRRSVPLCRRLPRRGAHLLSDHPSGGPGGPRGQGRPGGDPNLEPRQ